MGGINVIQSIDIKGAGQRATKLTNVSASNPGITIKSPSLPDIPYLVGTMSVSDFHMTGPSTGAAIEYDTMGNVEVSNITILSCGGVGIFLARTAHVATLTLSHVKIQNCSAAIYGRHVNSRQINVLNIVNGSEIIQNKGHGVDIWATVLNIKDSAIQGNKGAGINIEPSGLESTAISTIGIEGNYFELNVGGSLRVKTGAYAGGVACLIDNMTVSGNYFVEGTGPAPANRTVQFSCAGDGSAPYTYLNKGIQSGIWSENFVPIYAGNANAIDFGNSLSDLFVVRSATNNSSQSIAAGDWSPDYTKFVNLGKAKFEGWSNRIIHGKAFAESSGLTYGVSGISSRFNSSSITTVEFAIPTKTGEILMGASIPVYWDNVSALVDVTIEMRRVSATNPALGSSLGTTTLSNVSHDSTTIPKILKSKYLEQMEFNIDNYRSGFGKEEFHVIVTIKASSGSPAADFRCGNLIVRMN